LSEGHKNLGQATNGLLTFELILIFLWRLLLIDQRCWKLSAKN
jgi:hypothetical protein